MIGYSEMIYTDVEVNIDLTTTLDFGLNMEVLKGEAVTVKAEKSMINKGLTASAAIIGSLPILVGGALAFLSWEYMEVLFTTDTGHLLIGGGLGWMALGILVMRNMINFKT